MSSAATQAIAEDLWFCSTPLGEIYIAKARRDCGHGKGPSRAVAGHPSQSPWCSCSRLGKTVCDEAARSSCKSGPQMLYCHLMVGCTGNARQAFDLHAHICFLKLLLSMSCRFDTCQDRVPRNANWDMACLVPDGLPACSSQVATCVHEHVQASILLHWMSHRRTMHAERCDAHACWAESVC